jgi:hypothetical protein
MSNWVIILHLDGTSDRAVQLLARQFVSTSRIVTVGDQDVLQRRGGVQVGRPLDRGTTPDLLLALLQVLARDLTASVVVLRSDLVLEGDVGVQQAVVAALLASGEGAARAMLIAAEPLAETQEGHRVRSVEWGGDPWPRVLSVSRSISPPGEGVDGALIDTSVVVGEAWMLANFIHDRAPEWFRALRRSVWSPEDVAEAFEDLPPSDFFEDVLLPSVDALHVVPALRGWSPMPMVPANVRSTLEPAQP